jgi:hypothetical protein
MSTYIRTTVNFWLGPPRPHTPPCADVEEDVCWLCLMPRDPPPESCDDDILHLTLTRDQGDLEIAPVTIADDGRWA